MLASFGKVLQPNYITATEATERATRLECGKAVWGRVDSPQWIVDYEGAAPQAASKQNHMFPTQK